MTQTLALFVDAYRELNHRKLFWVTLGISGLIVIAFAAIGNDKEGLTIFHWSIPFPFVSTAFIPKADFYKFVFSALGVGFWLSWIASIIALVSTASIFPDFVDRGSIDLMLSKPIGRARLFLTKFATGLLFAAVQVTVFTVAAFLVIGIRGGDWEPWLLIAIPLVVVFYSYLFAVQAVIGLLTRSVIASVIGVMLFWMMISLIQSGDTVTLAWRVTQEITVERREARLETSSKRAAEFEAERQDLSRKVAAGDDSLKEALAEATSESDIRASRLINAKSELDDEKDNLATATLVNDWLHAANTVLPKTGETIGLLERLLVKHAGLTMPDDGDTDDNVRQFGALVGEREFNERMGKALDESHSYVWILGTSLGFEALVLGFGVWRFSRRDF
ncbi:MAG: hypothetical protein CMJ67_01240 [Planctomycetaceae bacterium]|nr:hypothetical protein [Planctomycetaceae bacterium]